MISNKLHPFGTTIFSEMTRSAEENGAINLAQGFPDFDGPREIIEAAVKALREEHNQYARSRGCLDLVDAVAEKVKRDYRLVYDPIREVHVFSGATEGIASTFLGLLNPGDEVVVFEPFYDAYPACIAMAGGVPRFYTLRFPDFTVDSGELEKCFSNRTRVLLLNNPHNPTGKVFNRQELTDIAELCSKYGVTIVTDEVYEHLTYDGVQHIPMASIPGMKENTLTISSAGKTFSFTGWKVGWATGPEDLISAVQAAHQYLIFATATPLQIAIAYALNNCNKDFFRTLQHEYTMRRDLLLEALNEAGFRTKEPRGAYFILADFTRLWDGDDRSFAHHLIEHCGVAAIPPSVFYTQDRDEGRHLVRFVFCKKLQTLSVAAERLKKLAG